MHTLLVAAASALLGATLLTELTTRLWPDNRVALLIASAIILFLTALLNARLANRARGEQRTTASTVPVRTERAAPRTAAERRLSSVSDGPRETGTVKWFNRTKGFGFIVRADGSEIFVHQRSIRLIDEGDSRRRPILIDGQQVAFIVTVRDKGPQAEDVVAADMR